MRASRAAGGAARPRRRACGPPPLTLSSAASARRAGPNQVWFADITYVPTWEGWLYVALVVDAWSRRIVGWSMRDGLEAELVVDALGMAATCRRPPAGAIHHSDRGSQYASTIFGRTLAESGLVASMGRRGCAYDNAACESAIASFKTELVHRRSFRSRNAAREEVFRWIEGWYNRRRRHSALGYLSPADFEELHMDDRGPCGPADADQPALMGRAGRRRNPYRAQRKPVHGSEVAPAPNRGVPSSNLRVPAISRHRLTTIRISRLTVGRCASEICTRIRYRPRAVNVSAIGIRFPDTRPLATVV